MSLQRPRWVSARAALSLGLGFLLLIVVAMGVLGPGCREQSTAPVDRDKAPETVLVGVPGDSTTTVYRVHLYWDGVDPDGEVVGYDWTITDSLPPKSGVLEYRRTVRTDSVFTFPVQEHQAILGHRFYVRAVDNEGKPDPTPAWTFFAVRDNCIPVTVFTRTEGIDSVGNIRQITSSNIRAPAETLAAGSSVRFSWRGSDCDRVLRADGTVDTVGKVTGFTYKLSPLEPDYLGGTLSDTAKIFTPIDLKKFANSVFVMYVRSTDDAGLSQLDPSVRAFVWNYDPQTYFVHSDSNVPTRDFYASIKGTSLDPNDYLNPSTGQPYHDGDTLNLTAPGTNVKDWFTATDPDPPYEIKGFQARVIQTSGFWTDLQVDPTGKAFFQDGVVLHTGYYVLEARARDAWGRWDGSPAVIHFQVNHAAKFRTVWSNGRQRPLAGERIHATWVDTAYADTLHVRLGAADADPYNQQVSLGPQFGWYLARFPLPSGLEGGEASPGDFVTAPDSSRDPTGREVIWHQLPGFDLLVRHQSSGEHFIPGDYTLVIITREAPPTGVQEYTYGFTDVTDTVHFTLYDDTRRSARRAGR